MATSTVSAQKKRPRGVLRDVMFVGAGTTQLSCGHLVSTNHKHSQKRFCLLCLDLAKRRLAAGGN